jgi:hypothetical protein
MTFAFILGFLAGVAVVACVMVALESRDDLS